MAEQAGRDASAPADGVETADGIGTGITRSGGTQSGGTQSGGVQGGGIETGEVVHEREAADGVEDEASPSGPRRVLIALYAIFALAATARAVVQLTTQYSDAPLAYLLSLFSGIVYIAATVGLVTNRAWSRPLAWAACGTELVGVVVIGIASIVDSSAFPHDTVWSRFGSGYGFIPLVLPLLGLSWLWQTRPTGSEDGPGGDPAS